MEATIEDSDSSFWEEERHLTTSWGNPAFSRLDYSSREQKSKLRKGGLYT